MRNYIENACVFPSDQPTVAVQNDNDEYGEGAHNYALKLMIGFEDGKPVYDKKQMEIQFVKKLNDGTWIPGAQSEQFALMLMDRHTKLNARFPSAQHDKAMEGLQMFLDALRERVEERTKANVMGELKAIPGDQSRGGKMNQEETTGSDVNDPKAGQQQQPQEGTGDAGGSGAQGTGNNPDGPNAGSGSGTEENPAL